MLACIVISYLHLVSQLERVSCAQLCGFVLAPLLDLFWTAF